MYLLNKKDKIYDDIRLGVSYIVFGIETSIPIPELELAYCYKNELELEMVKISCDIICLPLCAIICRN